MTWYQKDSIVHHYLVIIFFTLSFLLQFLNSNGSKIFQLPVLYLAITVIFVLALLFHIFRLIKAQWLFHALLVFLAADLAFGIMDRLSSWLRSSGFSPERLAVILYLFSIGFTSTLFFAVRSRIGQISLIAWGVFFASTIATLPFQQQSIYATRIRSVLQNPSNRPNIVFILVDEHLGMAGLNNMLGNSNLSSHLTEFYRSKGFYCFEKSHSNYNWTRQSLANILNRAILSGRRTSLPNRLFAKLYEEGFAINVYSSTYLELCKSQKFKCQKQFAYIHNSPGYIDDLPISLWGKMWILADTFLQSHKSDLLDHAPAFQLENGVSPVSTAPLATKQVLQEFAKDYSTGKQGQFYFVHLLIPHFSYIYRSDCTPSDWKEWGHPFLKKGAGVDVKMKKYQMYTNQVQCAQTLLMELVETLSKGKDFSELTMVIVSDHGSRITNASWDDFENYSSADYLNAFSALLLLKSGRYNAGYSVDESKKTAVSEVIGEYFQIPSGNSAEEFEYVYFRKGRGFHKSLMQGLSTNSAQQAHSDSASKRNTN